MPDAGKRKAIVAVQLGGVAHLPGTSFGPSTAVPGLAASTELAIFPAVNLSKRKCADHRRAIAGSSPFCAAMLERMPALRSQRPATASALPRSVCCSSASFRILLRRRQQQRRHRHGVGEIRRLPRFVDVLEEREQRVKILLRDRIELVIVAAAALKGQSEERRAERVDAIDDVADAEFLLDDAAFLVLHVQAVERGGQPLFLRRARAADRRRVAR